MRRRHGRGALAGTDGAHRRDRSRSRNHRSDDRHPGHVGLDDRRGSLERGDRDRAQRIRGDERPALQRQRRRHGVGRRRERGRAFPARASQPHAGGEARRRDRRRAARRGRCGRRSAAWPLRRDRRSRRAGRQRDRRLRWRLAHPHRHRRGGVLGLLGAEHRPIAERLHHLRWQRDRRVGALVPARRIEVRRERPGAVEGLRGVRRGCDPDHRAAHGTRSRVRSRDARRPFAVRSVPLRSHCRSNGGYRFAARLSCG